MCKLSFFDKLSVVLVLLGSIDLGIFGVFKVEILSLLVGKSNTLLRIVYILIFAAAIDIISLLFRCNIFKSLND